MSVDVLVIGGGLAGTVAALAARARGAAVAVAARSWGATALSTGALDLAYTPALAPGTAPPRPLRAHLEDIAAHRPRHPYGLIGAAAAEAAMLDAHAHLAPALAAAGLPLPALDLAATNLPLASTLGALLPSGGALPGHGGAALHEDGHWGILQVAGDAHSDAERIGRGLAHDAARRYGATLRFTTLGVTPPHGTAVGPHALARRLDDAAHAEAWGRQLAGRGAGLRGILAPPYLGLVRHAAVRAQLAAAAGVEVFEMLAHLPSVPGVRLQRALDAARAAAGVRAVDAIVTANAPRDRVEALGTARGDVLKPGAVVLASGRFVAGGMHWQAACAEALFGLPAASEQGRLEEESPHNVVRRTPAESHPLLGAGVQVDRRMQPVAEGRVAYRNLFAAGMIVGGFASRTSLCADGVALCSGSLAAAGACAP